MLVVARKKISADQEFGWYESLPSLFLGNPTENPDNETPPLALMGNDPEWFGDYLPDLSDAFASLDTDGQALFGTADNWDRWVDLINDNTGWRSRQTLTATDGSVTLNDKGTLSLHTGPITALLRDDRGR